MLTVPLDFIQLLLSKIIYLALAASMLTLVPLI